METKITILGVGILTRLYYTLFSFWNHNYFMTSILVPFSILKKKTSLGQLVIYPRMDISNRK